MKQKNLILMVVAVGCGLAAAFLTSRMSAGPKPEAVPQREILVAAKDLQPSTKFTKESIKDLVKKKVVNATEVAEDAIETEEELIEQSLIGPVSNNMQLQKVNLSKTSEVPIPAGKTGLISVKLPLELVTPFIKPTSRVNLMATVTNQIKRTVSGQKLIPNMHVTAVDTQYVPAPGAPQGIMQLQVVTLAVSNDEARLIRMAQMANVQLSFVLIGNAAERANTAESDWDLEKAVAWINDSIVGAQAMAPTPPEGPPMTTAPKYVKVPVAVEDLAAGTELTNDVIKTKFKLVDYLEAPANAVVELNGHIGHFLKKEVVANQFLTEAGVSNKRPMQAKAGADDAATDKGGAELPEKAVEKKKKPSRDRTVTTPTGTKTFRYEQQDDTAWKLIGEVQPDGTVTPTNGGVAPPAEEKKDDAKPGEKRVS